MPRNEWLVFRILRTLRELRAQYLEERSLAQAVTRSCGPEYSVDIVRQHLRMMAYDGLLKQVKLTPDRIAYALDWPGYDYLDAV